MDELPRESGSCMSEFERQLTVALKRFAQSELEWRQSEHIEVLRSRIERQTAQSATLQRQVEQFDGPNDTLGRVVERSSGRWI